MTTTRQRIEESIFGHALPQTNPYAGGESWDDWHAWEAHENRGYAGLTIRLRERNMHDDSDFYAVVFNGRCMVTIGDGTTRAYAPSVSRVDANDVAIGKALNAAYWSEYAAQVRTVRRECIREARRIRKGVRVVVHRGRKVPHGTTGTVIWHGTGYYGRERVGFKCDDGTVHWTDERNVRRIAAEWRNEAVANWRTHGDGMARARAAQWALNGACNGRRWHRPAA